MFLTVVWYTRASVLFCVSTVRSFHTCLKCLSMVGVTTWSCISVVVQVFLVVFKSCCYLIFNSFVRGRFEW